MTIEDVDWNAPDADITVQRLIHFHRFEEPQITPRAKKDWDMLAKEFNTPVWRDDVLGDTSRDLKNFENSEK